ncbi:MAG TPA: sterol desaturase family protein [Edaphocola sp.]|nr:sterol desaturase family protein [Edaphocola sp.]
MDSLREQLLILFSTPVYLVAIGLELLITHFHLRKAVYTVKDTLINLYFNIFNTAVDILCRLFYLAALQAIFNKMTFGHWQYSDISYWLFLLILVDFAFYWMHRFDHEIRLFWAVHVTHHSSEEFNFTTGFRSSILEPVYRFVYFIPITLLGFHPIDILFMYSLTQIWGTFVHTKLIGNMGRFIEYIFVTPSHHRVHHASNDRYLDKNMGMFLIIWDRMFGTFQKELTAEEYEPIHYGITKKIERPNAFRLVFHEWIQLYKDANQKGLTFHQRLLYIFGPPGYSHDSSRATTKDLQKSFARKKKL